MSFLFFTEDYVRQLAAGDRDVQDHFTSYFGAMLHMKLRARLRSLHTVEDVTQETFLRVFKALRGGTLLHPDRLGPFVNAVCNHVLLETYRDNHKHGEFAGHDAPDLADPSVNPETDQATRERKEMVSRTLSELSRKDSDLLRMVFIEERDKGDVCRDMKVNNDYLRVLVCRAKNRFGKQWKHRYRESAAVAMRGSYN